MNMDIKENVGLKKLRKGVRDVIRKPPIMHCRTKTPRNFVKSINTVHELGRDTFLALVYRNNDERIFKV